MKKKPAHEKAHLKIGQRVKTRFGNIETVMAADSSRVLTRENLGGWYHPTKVFPVKETTP